MNLVISNTTISQDAKGRYNLNDLHRASGGADKHKPSHFMGNQQTKDLIAELLSDGGIPPSDIKKGGKTQGTFVVKELVYAYGMWINPAFNLMVIRTFDKVANDIGDWRKLRHQSASSFKVANDILNQEDEMRFFRFIKYLWIHRSWSSAKWVDAYDQHKPAHEKRS